MLLNLAGSVAASHANGPGRRAVLWVQGCRRRCVGCHNPSALAHVVNSIVEVDAVVGWYRRQQPLRGMTLSGGEPFEQALALAAVARAVRGLGGDVIAYSGYTLHELRAGGPPHAGEMLAAIDLLVDGPYRQELASALPLRASSNQRLHFFSARIRAEEVEGLPRIEWLGESSSAVVSGFALSELPAPVVDAQ